MIEEDQGLFQVSPQDPRQLSIRNSIATSNFSYHSSYEQLLHFFKNLETNNLDMSLLNSSSSLKLKKYKQAVYYGEFVDGKRQGKGIMLYQSGQIYEGQWHADVREGHGYQKFINGCSYSGTYRQNKMNGVGKYEWPNGQIYQGEWLNNLKHGSGMWQNKEGDSFVGEWSQGQATGFGLFIQAHGSRYEGDFSKFVKEGKGTQKFQSGDVYTGEYVRGKFEGFGEYYWKDGSYYKGNFKEGVRSGHGVWKKGENYIEKYEGEFVNNKKEGYGIYTWETGHMYKGYYHDNLRHGYGQMFWVDNTFYKGEWQNDVQNGPGELFDGKQHIKGFFKDGQVYKQTYKCQLSNSPVVKPFATTNTDSYTSSNQTPLNLLEFQRIPYNLRVQRQPVISNFYTIDYARPVQYRGKKKTNNPLLPESFLKKKFKESISRHSPHSRQGSTHGSNKSSQQKVRNKTPHSAFQIHRLHRNRIQSGGGSINSNSLPTADNHISFAFRQGNKPVSHHRYYSRLQ